MICEIPLAHSVRLCNNIADMTEKRILFFFDEKNDTEKRKFQGLRRFAEARGFKAIALDAPRTAAAEAEMIRFWNPLAIVFHRGYVLHKRPDVPIVLLGIPRDRRNRSSGYVYLDNDAVTEVAARELLALNFDAYAFIPSPEQSWWNDARHRAFKSIIRTHGKRFFSPPSKADGSSPARYDRRLSKFITALPKPCGVFASNDEVGIRVIHVAQQLGLRIPEDIAVCGVGGIDETCLQSTPTLTSVLPDFEQCGILAGEMACQKAANPSAKPKPRAYGVLDIIRRGSTRLLSRRDTLVEQALDFIRSKASSGIGAKDVVRLFPCSRRMAEIRFARIAGHSILDEITDVRLQSAKSLLAQNDISLEAVANLSGWKDYNVFRNRFKALTGLSPNNWRKQNDASRTCKR